jgi:hypothetical protein
MTSLNLFSTKFHQVVNLIEGRAADLEYVASEVGARKNT